MAIFEGLTFLGGTCQKRLRRRRNGDERTILTRANPITEVSEEIPRGDGRKVPLAQDPWVCQKQKAAAVASWREKETDLPSGERKMSEEKGKEQTPLSKAAESVQRYLGAFEKTDRGKSQGRGGNSCRALRGGKEPR